jgi:hypothetical protein
MKSSKLLWLIGLCLVLTIPATARCQYYSPYSRQPYGPYYRPPISPYLDLTRGGNPAINYYLGVRPEIDRRLDEYQMSRDIQDLERRPPLSGAPEGDELVPTLSGTGHATGFMTFSPYYTSSPSAGGRTALSNPGSAIPSPARRGR